MLVTLLIEALLVLDAIETLLSKRALRICGLSLRRRAGTSSSSSY